MINLATGLTFRRLKVDGTNYTGSAATTDLTSEAVDMAGHECCLFICGFGAITSAAVTSVKAQQCDTSGGSYADLLGTSITVIDTADNGIFLLEIHNPRERFLKHVVDRGTQNAVVDFLLSIQGGAKEMATALDSMTFGREVHNGPAEGTA